MFLSSTGHIHLLDSAQFQKQTASTKNTTRMAATSLPVSVILLPSLSFVRSLLAAVAIESALLLCAAALIVQTQPLNEAPASQRSGWLDGAGSIRTFITQGIPHAVVIVCFV
jgi:hypothetical protein